MLKLTTMDGTKIELAAGPVNESAHERTLQLWTAEMGRREVKMSVQDIHDLIYMLAQ